MTAPDPLSWRYTDHLTLARETIDMPWRALWANDTLDTLAGLTAGRSIVDIGAGFGDLLAIARERGWTVRGTEASLSARSRALEWNDIRLDTPETFDFTQPADAVVCANVLEHVEDPGAVASDIHALLVPGGVAYFKVPNDYSVMQQSAPRPERRWWVSDDHRHYFTFEALESMLREVGFTIMRRSTSFPMEMFLMMGEDYVDSAAVGRACHWKRRAFEEAMPAPDRRRFYAALASGGFGRTAEVFARKDDE